MAGKWLPKCGDIGVTLNSVDGKIHRVTPINEYTTVQTTVRNIANAMEGMGEERQKVRSIPDIWARPALFETNLFNVEARSLDENDPVRQGHEFAQIEWRSLIALIVLQDYFELNLDITQIDLKREDKSIWDTVVNMRPERETYNVESWTPLYIFTVGGKAPIAISSPMTFVAPAADYLLELNNRLVPWISEDRHIDDPVEFMSLAQKKVIYFWLEEIMKSLDERKVHFFELFENFQKDLGMTHEDIEIPITFLKNDKFSDYDRFFVRLLDKPGISDDRRFTSDLFVIKNNKKTRYLLVDTSAPDNMFGKMDKDVRFMGPYDLETYKKFGKDAIAGMPDCDIIDINDLYLDNMYCYSCDGESNENTADAVSRRLIIHDIQTNKKFVMILPFDEKLHELIDDPNKDIKIQAINNEVYVCVTLNLTGGPHTLERTFSRGGNRYQIIELEDYARTITAIWPNVKVPGWNSYFMMCKVGAISNEYMFEPMEYDNKAGHPVQEPSAIYYSLRDFPKALKCIRRNEIVGFVTLEEPKISKEMVNRMGQPLNIGIDFGTSATVAYQSCNENGKASRQSPIQLHNRLAVVSREQGSVGRDALAQNFLGIFGGGEAAEDKKELMVSTVLHNFMGNEKPKEAILDAHPFFQGVTAASVEIGRLCTNLKWGENTDNESTAYLTSMIILISLEAMMQNAPKISWRFSFPVSLKRTENYQTICKVIIQNVKSMIGSVSNSGPEMISESEATARYFYDRNKFNINPTHIATMDIGGGSTDIFLAYRDTRDVKIKLVCLESSVRMGGRDMLLRLFKEKTKFFRKILKKEEFIGQSFYVRDKIYNSMSLTDFYACLEQIFLFKVNKKKVGMPVTKAEKTTVGCRLSAGLMVDVEESLQTEMRLFRSILAFNIGSLFYYTGLMIRYMRNEVLKDIENPVVPNIGVAGNGSNIINWISDNPGIADIEFGEKLQRYIDELVYNSAEITDLSTVIKTVTSGEPKREAAYGIVSNGLQVDNKPIDKSKDLTSVILAGVGFKTAAGEDIKPLSSMEGIKGQISSVDMSEIENMLIAYNAFAKEMGLFRIQLQNSSKVDYAGRFIGIDRNQLLQSLKISYSQAYGNGEALEPMMNTIVRTINEELIQRWKSLKANYEV